MQYLRIRAKECGGSLEDKPCTTTLQEELNQFIRNDVWYLVLEFKDKHVIGT